MKRKSRNPLRRWISLVALTSRPKYAGEPVKRFTLAAPPTILSTTVTTGVIASTTNLDARGTIAGFLTRFQNTFDTYRVLKVVVKIRPLTVATGVTRMWFETSLASASDSATAASERVARTLSNSQADSKSTCQMSYEMNDIQELQYVSVASTQEPAYPIFYVYTDTASWGAPIAVTPLWLIEPIFTVEFRGLAST